MTGLPTPGVARLTVLIAAVVAGALGYPWRTGTERWVLGVAVGLAVVCAACWRGRFLTTILRQWLRMILGRNPIQQGAPGPDGTVNDSTATVLLKVAQPGRQVPVGLLTGYLDRYGLVCDSIRLTTRSTTVETTTWVGLTFSAARNLAALQARSAQLPLRDTAEAAARRLISELGEIGCPAELVDQVPDPAADDAREHWRSVTDSRGHVTTYIVDTADEETLAAIRSAVPGEAWTVLEIGGTPALPRITAGAAIRTDDSPTGGMSVPGLVAVPGRQAVALSALHPLSGARLVS